MPLEDKLESFAQTTRMKGKGPLCVALVVTRHASSLVIHLNPDVLPADGGFLLKGTMLQHFVGAKLNPLLESRPTHHGGNVADNPSGRNGDFIIEDVAIHVTTAPSEALMRKGQGNLFNGLKPVITTTCRGVVLAEGLAGQANIADRLDVFEMEQFLAGNLYAIGKFTQAGRRTTAERLIEEYNAIIDECETDPSLRITVA